MESILVGQEPGDGVEFMVTHNCRCIACINHTPHNIEGFELLRLAVNEIPYEDRLTLRMSPGVLAFPITCVIQQRLQCLGMAVDVSNDVVVQIVAFLAWFQLS